MKKQVLSRAGLAVLLLGSGALTVRGAEVKEWHQWRGPNRDAVSGDTGLLREWPASGPKLAWKATGLGGGFSGVSFWGDRIWQSKEVDDKADYSSAIVAEIGGVRQVIAVSDLQVMGVAASDGKVLWRAARPARNVIPTPLYKDNIVFISSGYNAGCHGFRISKQDATFKAEQVYADPRIANQHGGSILVGDHVYTSIDAGGLLTCLEFKTGKVVWQDKCVGKASLGYADGLLVARSENGPVALVEATPAGYKEKGRFDQPDRSKYNSWPHPVISGGRMDLRDQDVLLCYELKADSQ